MKVLHVINTLSAGGAELHLLTLCRRLKQQGVDLVVACLRENVRDSRSLRPDFCREGIRVYDLRAGSRWDLGFVHRVLGVLREEEPDLLHTHLPRADFAGAIAHRFFPSVPWVCSVHDIHSKSWSGRWLLPILDIVWRRADAVVAISQAVKDWLVGVQRVPAKKVRVIPYGIEPDHFEVPVTDLRKMWDLNGKAVVGSIGRLEPRKGHDCLIRAMPHVLQRMPNTRLVIAGHDPWGYGEDLGAIVRRLNLEEQVRLIGFQDDVPSFLHSLDIFAFASISEGFGQVIIEAMAAGKPVVANRIPPITEIVVHGETGLLVECDDPRALGEAICSLLTHPERAQQMAKEGQARVHDLFTAERMARETLSLYRALDLPYNTETESSGVD